MSQSGEEARLYIQRDVPLKCLTKKDGSMRYRCGYMYATPDDHQRCRVPGYQDLAALFSDAFQVLTPD
jgi:hypothetical protein